MNTVDQMLDEGFEAYNAGDYEKAESMARYALELSPTHGDALALLANCAMKKGAFKFAKKLLLCALELYPDHKEYQEMMVTILMNRGEYEAALPLFEKMGDKPNQALAESCLGHDDKALALIREVLAKDKEKWSHRIIYGIILGNADQKEDALKVFQKIISDDAPLETQARAFYEAARLLRDMNRPEEGLEYIEKAIQVAPVENLNFEVEKALLTEKTGDFQKAFQLYHNLFFSFGRDPLVYFNLGNVLRRLNKIEDAESSYQWAIKINPDFAEAHHNLADLYDCEGIKQKALHHYHEALRIDPQFVPSLYNLAVFLEKMGEFEESFGLYFNVLALGGILPDLEFRMAAALVSLAQKKPDLAKKFVEGWVKNVPESVVACHTKAALNGEKAPDPTAYAEQLYRVFAPDYDAKMKELKAAAIQKVAALIPGKKGRLLDLGCGTGQLGVALKKKKNLVLTGVDISAEMLLQAHKKEEYFDLYQGRAEDFLAQTDMSFDVVTAVEVLEYVADVKDFFKHVDRVLKDNGLFVFSAEVAPKTGLSVSGRQVFESTELRGWLRQAFKNTIVSEEEVELRREGNAYARGLIIACKKTA